MLFRTVASALLVALLAGSVAYAQVGAVGVWDTHHAGGVVQISECDGALCGKVVSSTPLNANPDARDVRNADARLRNRLLKGLTVFYGVKGGPSEWSGGSVYNPEDGKTYHGSIKLVDANTLKLTGCIFGPLCKSQTWTRIR